MKHNFIFKSINEKNFKSLEPLLLTWFKEPHIDQWWPVPKESEAFFNSFLKRIRSGTKPYLVLCNNVAIGYIQTYNINLDKNTWLPKITDNSIGIDQFIGETEYLYKGIGPLFIKEFIQDIIFKKDKSVTVVIDPDPTNIAAIKCYQKVGFKELGTHQAPWGPALVMVYKI